MDIIQQNHNLQKKSRRRLNLHKPSNTGAKYIKQKTIKNWLLMSMGYHYGVIKMFYIVVINSCITS